MALTTSFNYDLKEIHSQIDDDKILKDTIDGFKLFSSGNVISFLLEDEYHQKWCSTWIE